VLFLCQFHSTPILAPNSCKDVCIHYTLSAFRTDHDTATWPAQTKPMMSVHGDLCTYPVAQLNHPWYESLVPQWMTGSTLFLSLGNVCCHSWDWRIHLLQFSFSGPFRSFLSCQDDSQSNWSQRDQTAPFIYLIPLDSAKMFRGTFGHHWETFGVHCCILCRSQRIPAVTSIPVESATIFQVIYPTYARQTYKLHPFCWALLLEMHCAGNYLFPFI